MAKIGDIAQMRDIDHTHTDQREMEQAQKGGTHKNEKRHCHEWLDDKKEMSGVATWQALLLCACVLRE